MTEDPHQPWEALLPRSQPGMPAIRLNLRLLRRQGHPLLLIPARGAAARTALDLYAAQTWKARLARLAIRNALRLGFSLGLKRISLSSETQSPFAKFLAGNQPLEGLQFAILLGNPNVPGRRFVLLVMDAAGEPLRVVKAGTSPAANQLILREGSFLQTYGGERLRSPALLDVFSDGTTAAIGLEHLGGTSPRQTDVSTLPSLMSDWLNPGPRVAFGSLPAAERLMKSGGLNETEASLLTKMETHPVAMAIHHGDFTPWNIRVTPHTRAWRVLDWERGEASGPPAWDWFHFVIQPAVLVQGLPAQAVLERMDGVKGSAEFRTYSRAAGIETHVNALLLAYLLYCREVMQQTEGMPVIRQLARLMTDRLAM